MNADIDNLKEGMKDRKEEIRRLEHRVEDMGKSYAVGFDNFYTEFESLSKGIEEIKTMLYNNNKTGEKGLIQSFSILRNEFYDLKVVVEKIIGEKDSRRRRLVKLWSRITIGVAVGWALFKEFWHDAWVYITTINHK